jgi:hypothetical protein
MRLFFSSKYFWAISLAIIVCLSILTKPAGAAPAMQALNQCDTHEWYPESYGSNVTTTLDYGTYHGREALRASFTVSGPLNYAYVRTDHVFAPENWGSVTRIMMSIWIESGTNKYMHLEIKDIDDNEVKKPLAENIGCNNWVDVCWNVVPPWSNEVAKILMVPGGLQDGDVMYFSNMHITISAKDEIWETFEAPTYKWTGSEDFNPWKPVTDGYPRNEPISHKQTYNGSAGALYIPWDADCDAAKSAKMETADLHDFDFTGFDRMRAQVRSNRTDAPVFIGFWDGTWAQTVSKNVSTEDTWELLEWELPGGITWENLQSFMFMVDTTAGGTGDVYIDAIDFFLYHTPTVTPSPSITPTSSHSATFTHSPTNTSSPTISPTPTISQTYTVSPTNSPTGTITLTSTISPTSTITPTITITNTIYPTGTPMPTIALDWGADQVRIGRNSFNPARGESLDLQVDVKKRGKLRVTIYSRTGKKIDDLVNRETGPGVVSLVWNGKTSSGQEVPSGIYIVFIDAPDQQVKRLIAVIK